MGLTKEIKLRIRRDKARRNIESLIEDTSTNYLTLEVAMSDYAHTYGKDDNLYRWIEETNKRRGINY